MTTSQKPFSSSPASKLENTGSLSRRGKHHQTIRPCVLTSAAMRPLPMGARSRLAISARDAERPAIQALFWDRGRPRLGRQRTAVQEVPGDADKWSIRLQAMAVGRRTTEILEGHGPTRCAQSEFKSLADTPPRRLRRDTQYMTPAPADTKAENR